MEAVRVTIINGHGAPELKRALKNPWFPINQYRDGNGHTMLHTATRADNIECVRLLINAGADVTIPNDDGETPLHTALKTFRVGTSTRTHFRHRALLPLLVNDEIINKGEKN